MKIWDKIKEFLGIKQKEPEPASLPAAQNPFVNNSITFTRANGTSVTVTPMLDPVGNQLYKQVNKSSTNKPQFIPRYTISCDELESIAGTTITDILIDMKSDILRNENYASYFANNIFSEENITEMLNWHESYFGEIEVNKETGKLKTSFNNEIVNDIKSARKAGYRMDNQRYAQNQQAQTRQINENVANKSFEITPNQAQVLTSCPYPDER